MSDLPKQSLVTIALFAYNQEKYIHDAVESMLSQDFESLEIILSDDCSSDRTFEIMQGRIAEYQGPHRVILRRSIVNVGTALHVQEVFAASSGELFVVAAGDDISLPGRVSTLFATWDRAGRPSGLVHSGWETFSGRNGTALKQFPPRDSMLSESALQGYARARWPSPAAPTVAYTRDVFEEFSPLFGGSIIEDQPLFLRAALVGCFTPCDDVLVRLRVHEDNSGTGYLLNSPNRWNRFMQSKLVAYRNMQADIVSWQEIDPLLRARIERRILTKIQSVGGLFLPQASNFSRVGKLRFFFRMTLASAVAPRFHLRLLFTLSFFGFDFQNRLIAFLRRYPPRPHYS